jgi:hypothetical protein
MTTFDDDDIIPGYARDAAEWGQQTGVVKGREDYGWVFFDPDRAVSRAEAVTFLHRYETLIAKRRHNGIADAMELDVQRLSLRLDGLHERLAALESPDGPVDPEPPVEPDPDPVPSEQRGLTVPISSLTQLSGAWRGGNGARLEYHRGGFVSIDDSDDVVVYNYHKAGTGNVPQDSDGLVIVGYSGNVSAVTLDHVDIGGRPVREGGAHVDTVQIWAKPPHTVRDVTIRNSILGGSANAALMIKEFYGTLLIENSDIRKQGQHCVRAHAAAGMKAMAYIDGSDVAQVSLEGDWDVNVTGSTVPGGITLNGKRIL